MGYRSEVCYVIVFPNDDELSAFITQAGALSLQRISPEDAEHLNPKKEFWGDLQLAINECRIMRQLEGDEVPALYFRQENVKWYSTYPDVYAHESLIDLAWVNYDSIRPENNEDYTYIYTRAGDGTPLPPVTVSRIAYEYMRVGEDSNDIEHTTHGTSPYVGRMYVERRISSLPVFDYRK